MHRQIVTWMILLVLPLWLEAQKAPKMNLPSIVPSSVALATFSPEEHTQFNKVFDRIPAIASVQPASFVVLNESDRAIVGIAVRWIVTDSGGKETQFRLYTHSYLSPDSAPIIPPHNRMLIAPGSFVPESAMNSKGFIGSAPDEVTVAKFQAAVKVRVEIDSIIFADGEVVGPSPLQLIRDIKDRKVAADLVVRYVNDARSLGKNPEEALRELESKPVAWGPGVGMYRSLFIRQLVGTKHFDSVLEHLKGIAVPPIFFRKDGSEL